MLHTIEKWILNLINNSWLPLKTLREHNMHLSETTFQYTTNFASCLIVCRLSLLSKLVCGYNKCFQRHIRLISCSVHLSRAAYIPARAFFHTITDRYPNSHINTFLGWSRESWILFHYHCALPVLVYSSSTSPQLQSSGDLTVNIFSSPELIKIPM